MDVLNQHFNFYYDGFERAIKMSRFTFPGLKRYTHYIFFICEYILLFYNLFLQFQMYVSFNSDKFQLIQIFIISYLSGDWPGTKICNTFL